MTISSRKTVDLFAGPGGWDIAATELGFDVTGLENDRSTCATRRAAGLKTLEVDVAAFNPRELGQLDGLIASPPCRVFSVGGGSPALSDRYKIVHLMSAMRYNAPLPKINFIASESKLVAEVYRYALQCNPRWIACEQVPAILPVWHELGRLLEHDGYYVWTGLLNTKHYQIPQDRTRAFLLARKEGHCVLPPGWASESGPSSWIENWRPDDMIGLPRKNRNTMRRADLPAFTVTGQAEWWMRQFGHTSVPVSQQELCVIQSVAPDYPFQGSKRSRHRQLGQMVPPQLAKLLLLQFS